MKCNVRGCVCPSDIIPEFMYPVANTFQAGLWKPKERFDRFRRPQVVNVLWAAMPVYIYTAWAGSIDLVLVSMFSNKHICGKSAMMFLRSRDDY